MKNFLKLFSLFFCNFRQAKPPLNPLLGLIFASAICPDSPTIPSSSIPASNPLVITPTSPVPSSTRVFTFIVTLTPNEQCTPGSTFPLLSLTITPAGGTEVEFLTLFVNCADYKIGRRGDWLYTDATGDPLHTTSTLGPMTILYTFDLSKQSFQYEHVSNTAGYAYTQGAKTLPLASWNFDATTKINLCSQKGGTAARACTVSDLKLIYSHLNGYIVAESYAGGTTPSLAAFYPLTGPSGTSPSTTSLPSSFGSAGPGYFGDSASLPTAGTTPSWDSSNAFVKITSKEQFLTFPLPTLQPGSAITFKSLSVSAWVRIQSLPVTETTIFATYAPDGTQAGVKLVATQDNLRLYGGSKLLSARTTTTKISLNQWQLVGFDIYLKNNLKAILGTIFVGKISDRYWNSASTTAFDLTTPTLLRVGGSSSSFIGDVSTLRILTPGGLLLTTSDTCLPQNSIELGTNSFALSCSGNNGLNPLDSKCYASCPEEGTYPSATTSLCVRCPTNCKTCDATQCLTCPTGSFLYQKACVVSCPDGTYVDGSTCVDCPSGCETCESTACLTCNTNYLFYQGTCVNSCPPKSFDTGSSTCSSCDPLCETCEKAAECLTCNSISFLSGTQCVLECPPTTYGDANICKDCSNIFNNCQNCDKSQCLTCKANYLLYNKACVDQCPLKTYETSSSNCADCPAHCATCDDKGCSTCDDNYLLYQGTCLNSCPLKTYETSSATCKDCPSGCRTCNDARCLTCEANYLFYQEGCVNPCPSGTYGTSSSICEDCPTHCTACNNMQCSTCDPGYFIHDKACVNSCPERMYSTGSACANCLNSCTTCDQTGCLTCDSNYFIYKGTCVDQCPDGTFFELSSCIPCSKNCAKCNAKECISCANDYSLDKNGECIAMGGLPIVAIAGIFTGSSIAFGLAAWFIYVRGTKKAALSVTRIRPEISTASPRKRISANVSPITSPNNSNSEVLKLYSPTRGPRGLRDVWNIRNV